MLLPMANTVYDYFVDVKHASFAFRGIATPKPSHCLEVKTEPPDGLQTHYIAALWRVAEAIGCFGSGTWR
jgi:hypothetical protein